MSARSGPNSVHGLDHEIIEVAVGLRESVGPIVDEVSGASLRPASLARTLGIDKTLSGRVLRSIKAVEPFEVVHNAPAPYGLRLFIEAAARAGVEIELRERAERSIARFESLIESFPDGRIALEAAISDHLPEVQARAERAARQGAYKSMSYLIGYQAKGLFQASILSPSEDGVTLDFTHVSGLHELRRLRGRAPTVAFGIRRFDTSPDLPTWIETIDGERDQRDAFRYLLSEFCDHPLPDLVVQEDADLTHLVLRASSLPVNTPATLVSGWVSRKSLVRYKSESRSHEWHTGLVRIPTRIRVQDYFVHRDVLPGTPDIRAKLHSLVASHVAPIDDEVQIDEVDLPVSVKPIGMGLNRSVAKNPAMPGYDAMLARVFERTGHNPADFRVYRCEIVYPVPFVSLTAWFELPDAPGDS